MPAPAHSTWEAVQTIGDPPKYSWIQCTQAAANSLWLPTTYMDPVAAPPPPLSSKETEAGAGKQIGGGGVGKQQPQSVFLWDDSMRDAIGGLDVPHPPPDP